MARPNHQHDLSTVDTEVRAALERAPCHFIDGEWCRVSSASQ
jgi:hypothetical protein